MTDKDSKEGNLLLDFLTFAVDYKNSVSKNAFDWVIDSFKQHSRVEKNECGRKTVYFDFATVVWKNFSILSPKLVLEYAEDILSDSRLKNCAKCKGG